ncbi:ADP-ribose pyrophosphatase [Pilimelia anulata]|uniref:ADP-ribose pyrophosphatase n=1 Tax=Pilimelia anulata TaxID=53371 RepID=A0A8J3FED1_9ACTN|nr:NUDIX hydrolase [Pilimelia anulata]GGK07872.1 ADP-ribose pyrophosphatase [Pilimelia anulata]
MTADGYAVRGSRTRYAGPIFTVVSDEVAMPDGGVAARDVVRKPGAVGVVALDDAGAVTLVRQYRHPLAAACLELPAGLLDVPGEAPAAVARRELAEETDLLARRWDALLDLHTSPGFTDELFRVYLARDLSPAPQRHARRHEEAAMTVERVPLDAALDLVRTGAITSGPTIAGLFAARHARDRGWADLRPA